jgi:hypothetical protein
MAAHKVQWVLCFDLAVLVQSLQEQQQQRRRQQQQQVQGTQPAEQLLSALGLPAGFDCSRFSSCLKDQHSHLVLLSALHNQLKAAKDEVMSRGDRGSLVEPEKRTQLLGGADTVLGSDPASEQQEQQSNGKSLQTAAEHGMFVGMPPQLVRPLVMTLVQLCRQEQTGLHLMECILHVLHSLLAGCETTALYLSIALHSDFGTLKDVPPERKAAAAEACSSYKAVLGDLTEPLLCQMGPAVLRAVRKVEKLPSSGHASSSRGGTSRSSSSGLQPGRVQDAEAVQLADSVMSSFGSLVQQYVQHIRVHHMDGE